ncbi:conserved hypothetical protein [Paraburkholderia piptadeniae]|uniref:DUF3592 domain-containing protein n=1 Tax=Paraburkholderia piptadeniae TaxID=1701573 RepID=A0A1N7S6A0_9BURK|nr:DUF3592 domain-containing protein [Paraburkholderia piptadeniae]SIT42944.1 conserved hypothetical protein [Paraburkholderia piptadeniae]
MPVTDELFLQRCKAVLFTIVWIGCVIGLVNSVENTRAFLGSAVTAPGRVVALNAGGSHPQIEFVTRRGERVSYPQGGWIAGYKVGDKVNVLYLESSPRSSATIDRVGAVWELAIYFAFMSIVIPLIGLINMTTKKLNRRSKAHRWKITE